MQQTEDERSPPRSKSGSVPFWLQKQLAREIVDAGGIETATANRGRKLSAIYDNNKDSYGEAGSKRRKQVQNKVRSWKQLTKKELEAVFEELGVGDDDDFVDVDNDTDDSSFYDEEAKDLEEEEKPTKKKSSKKQASKKQASTSKSTSNTSSSTSESHSKKSAPRNMARQMMEQRNSDPLQSLMGEFCCDTCLLV